MKPIKNEENMGRVIKFKSGKNKESTEFISIYEKYFSSIYRFIYYKTYNTEITEDITSQTFLKALENYNKYDSTKGSFSSWLYRIARNLVIDHYRKKNKTVNINDVWELAGNENVEIDVQNKEQHERIKEILKSLPLKQRDIVIMKIWQDMTYKEIAEVLGSTEAGCKMMFSRTMAKIRETISLAGIILLYISNTLH